MAEEEPPGCLGQYWSDGLCSFCQGDLLCFVVVNLYGEKLAELTAPTWGYTGRAALDFCCC